MIAENDFDLPDSIRELLAETKPTTEADLKRLGRAIRALDKDPAFQADLQKSLFVNRILEAMEEMGMNKNQLAKRIGKSRQYVSKILNEATTVNFTIESLTELAMAVGLRLEVHLLGRDEATHVLRCRTRRTVEPLRSQLDRTGPTRLRSREAEFSKTGHPFSYDPAGLKKLEYERNAS